jgi:hypothetical protein
MSIFLYTGDLLMPKRKKSEKPVEEMTTDELAKKVFHPRVLAKAKKELEEFENDSKKKRHSSQ